MWTKPAAIAFLPLMVGLAAPAHAQPNYVVFLQAIAGDGIEMNASQAVQEGHAVCQLMAPPNGGALWDAGQQVMAKHPDWTIHMALKFADRSVQDICPNRGAF